MYRALTLPDGRLLALSIERVARQQTMQARYSTDEGRTWSSPTDLFLWPKEAGGFALFEALVDRKGEIQIWSLCDGNSGVLYRKEDEAGKPARAGQILDVWHVRSRDRRTRWETPRAIWTGRGSDLLSAIQLRSGRLLLPLGQTQGRTWGNRGGGFLEFTFAGHGGVSSLYSDDDGATWQQSADLVYVQTPNLGTFGAAEPVVIELKDGRVWMLIRTQMGRFYESFSTDGGVHWSPAQPSSLISSDSPAALIRLPDGNILLISNACLRFPYAYGARNVLHVAVSPDEGRTWRGFREVVRDPLRNEPPPPREDYGLSYSFPTVTAGGRVLFSNWVETGRDRTFRLFDPAWIYETRQESDFSRGIDDWSTFGSKGVALEDDAEQANRRVLAVHKTDKDWPAGAVWNFPIGAKGKLEMDVKLAPEFGGTLVGLTDHFSVPWDLEDQHYNVFNLRVEADGQIFPNVKLSPGRWYHVTLDWDTTRRQCRVSIDGKPAGVLEDQRRTAGINYLRLRSVAERPDGGLLLRNVKADVSASWPASTREKGSAAGN
jgi:hypothetical protein